MINFGADEAEVPSEFEDFAPLSDGKVTADHGNLCFGKILSPPRWSNFANDPLGADLIIFEVARQQKIERPSLTKISYRKF